MTAPTPAGPDPDAERAPAAAPDRAEQVLARFGWARLWAAARAPYLVRALFALQPVLVEAHLDEDTGEPVADPALRAFPTDTRWRVHLDPGTALATPVAEIGWWMLHHIGHLVRHHAERAPAPPESPTSPAASRGPPPPGAGAPPRGGGAGGPRAPPPGARPPPPPEPPPPPAARRAARPRGAAPAAGGRQAARPWNRAADAEVNDDLESMGLTTPAGVVSPRGLGLPPGRLAEEYLSLIEVLDAAHRRGGRPLADPIDCGGAVDGIDDAPPGAGGPAPGLDDTERDLLELAVAREIETRSIRRATVPGGWRRWADRRLRPAVDWRAELGALLRRGVRRAAGRVDFTYARPSRRTAGDGIVMPAMVGPDPDVALVVDTSGSITPAILTGFLTEITEILARAAGPRRRLRVICCDRRAHGIQTVRRVEDIELVGGGGTDQREGMSAALALRPRPDLILVLTDGQTPWPDRRPPVPVVIGLVEPGPGLRAQAPPPAWARTIPLPAGPPSAGAVTRSRT